MVCDHLDDELLQAKVKRLDDGALRERAADAAPAAVGVDDDPHLAHVARPALERHDRDVAEHSPVLDGKQARRLWARPVLAHPGVIDVLLEKRAVALGNALHERLDCGLVPGL